MSNMVELSEAIKVLRDDDQLIQKSLIGGALLILSVFTVPVFFYQGYLMRILKQTEDGDMTGLPEWENWKELLIDGGIASAFSFVIMIPVYACFILPALIVGPIYSLLGFIPLLIVSYLSPAMLTLLMRDDMYEAINWKRLRPILLSKQYILVFCIIIGLSIAFTVFTFVYIVFTYFMGIFAYPFVIVPLNCLFMYLIGQTVTETDVRKDEGE